MHTNIPYKYLLLLLFLHFLQISTTSVETDSVMAYKVLLFLGAGRNVGASTVELFKNEGYRVASVARTTHDNVKKHSDLCLTVDFSDPSSIEGVFKRVEKELGVPNVVIYNRQSTPESPLSALDVNITVANWTSLQRQQ